MSALFSTPLTAPTRRVEAVEVVNNTTARYSRTLDQHRPTERSSRAQIVPMDSAPAVDRDDRIVLAGCVLACFALVVLIVGGLLP